ncbi:prepilin-type N-terminal cleavage/methylation domain-containing protein [Clostridium perfringens]|uniref:Prepilin-type N-terminal cleavage/methylation domain-containing protein n=1 Tax=Clostridium perfringens TaxID=1502 RepID=A0AAW9J3G4_CLOPF|nr:prepilin-type N-terminal cleavage/methylation domain-containing protein [Clostridium perfringens]MDZ5034171.1 prepilin-type N-terminal cleavage/methylation domain-containing protein [Clostridium perfringens]MDZ7543376.1 prepilin-type N-terminal cleavage/methylation domain-containing protein [Clostridium perfringens]
MIKNANNKKKKRGFTLIELIIVIAIIAILAALAIPKFGQVRKNANIKADVANAKTIANAAASLIAENKLTIPTGDTATEYAIDSTADNEIEKYIQNVPTPKSETGNFKVTIDKDGSVKVLVGNKSFFPASEEDVK